MHARPSTLKRRGTQTRVTQHTHKRAVVHGGTDRGEDEGGKEDPDNRQGIRHPFGVAELVLLVVVRVRQLEGGEEDGNANEDEGQHLHELVQPVAAPAHTRTHTQGGEGKEGKQVQHTTNTCHSTFPHKASLATHNTLITCNSNTCACTLQCRQAGADRGPRGKVTRTCRMAGSPRTPGWSRGGRRKQPHTAPVFSGRRLRGGRGAGTAQSRVIGNLTVTRWERGGG